jgi:excisionase family DNA binding protein
MESKREAYTVKEVAEKLGVSEHTVHRYMDAGKLKYIKPGQYLIPVEALEKFTKGE